MYKIIITYFLFTFLSRVFCFNLNKIKSHAKYCQSLRPTNQSVQKVNCHAEMVNVLKRSFSVTTNQTARTNPMKMLVPSIWIQTVPQNVTQTNVQSPIVSVQLMEPVFQATLNQVKYLK